jgi:glutaminyl-peptide cyclotransferase
MNMRCFIAVAIVLVSGWFVMPFFSGQTATEDVPQDRKTEFAADQAPDEKNDKPAVAFDSKRAMDYLDKICAIGPRVSGTGGMRRQQDLIQKHFEDLGAKVVFQPFTAKQRSRPEPVEMANIIVSWHAERDKRVILCSHYDTRPIADQEKDPRKWREKFLSANDGGSGVAMLMEMGNHMKELKTKVGVDFVFFDGEEYIFDNRHENGDRYFFGSEHFAKTWRKSKSRPNYLAAILLDMIAGPNARFPAEGHSWLRSRLLVQEIWALARELRATAFDNKVGERVLDDHLALINAGIPAIDIIDFEYPHWHKLSDIPDNCSPESMEQVARVLNVWLQRK